MEEKSEQLLISDDEQRKIQLDLLTQIDEICVSQGFRYSLAFGTLIGAIRHGGFIPWDDDIDIAMPRPDYDKFVEYCQSNNTPFFLACTKTDERYGYMFAKACAFGTQVIQHRADRFGCPLGVFVDIFPIDGLGENKKQAEKNFMKREFSRELLVASNWAKFFRNENRSFVGNAVRLAFYIASRSVKPRRRIERIEKFYRKIDFDKSEYAGVICGAYRKREIMPREIFSEYIKVQFEGKSFNAFARYDEYLRALYGDYMTPPPVEKQVTHHDYTAYYKKQDE